MAVEIDEELDRQATTGLSQKSPQDKMLSERDTVHEGVDQVSAAEYERMQHLIRRANMFEN